jgi:chitinase
MNQFRWIRKVFTLLLFVIIAILLNRCNWFKQEPPTPVTSKIVLGYYWTGGDPSLSFLNRIKYSNLTHIAHAFAIPQNNGSLNLKYLGDIQTFVSSVHQEGLKAILSVGGAGQSDPFKTIATNPNLRTLFAANLADFCLDNNYDGADIDWEFPEVDVTANDVTNLIIEIYDRFKASGHQISLSMAIPAGGLPDKYKFDLSTLKNYIKWFGVMTYDNIYTDLSKATHNSPLSMVANCVQDYHKYISKSQLLIGIPFYGHKFHCPNGPAIGASVDEIEYGIKYCSITPFLSMGNWQHKWDDNKSVPYLINETSDYLITYDDEESIKVKCEYINNNFLGGAIIWALGQDDIGTDQPLLCTVGKELLGVSCNPKTSDLSGTWEGIADETTYPKTHYTMSASFSQLNLTFSGFIQWNDNWGGQAKENIIGTISPSNSISISGSSLENVVNKFPVGYYYITGNYYATISAKGDSLIGGWKFGTPGNFVLKRK